MKNDQFGDYQIFNTLIEYYASIYWVFFICLNWMLNYVQLCET